MKKFPIEFNAGYKFSTKWNEKIIIYFKKYNLCLDFASNNIKKKKRANCIDFTKIKKLL